MYQRNMIQRLMTFTFLLLASFQVAMAHFITDDGYRSKVENAFGEKMMLVGEKFFDVKELKKSKANDEEKEALRFLYAYMPMADVTDYPTAFFLAECTHRFSGKKGDELGQ